MAFAGINHLAVLLAAIAAFVVGALWYGTLSRPWMKAARIDPADARMSPSLFVITFACELVMAFVLAGLIGHLGEGQVTLRNGLVSGFLVWAGFMSTTMIVNHRYGRFGWDLTLIDGAHWLLAALVMGGVIGFMGA
jgi:hypothetical protein